MKNSGTDVRLLNFYDENHAIDPIKLLTVLYSSPIEILLSSFNEITFCNCKEEKSIKK
jgi:hypothetical protein